MNNLEIDISIVIVNYNTQDFISNCIKSIEAQTDVNYQVIVIDNASKDDSVSIIKKDFRWIKLIENAANKGFAYANNQALDLCEGRYIYFLNPDTELKKGALKASLNFMESNPEVGAAGTKLINPDGTTDQNSIEYRYPSQKHAKSELKDLKGSIAWVMGASLIAKSELVYKLNGFDEKFFLYGEDADFCLNIRKQGYLIGYINDAQVIHWGGQSERENLPKQVFEKKIKAELIFYNKHYSRRTMASIKKENIIKAYWRIFILKLTMPFARDKEKILNKLDRYRLVLKYFSK